MFSNESSNFLTSLGPTTTTSNNNANDTTKTTTTTTASTSSSRNTSTARPRNRRQASFINDGQDNLDESGGSGLGIPRRQSSLSLSSSPNTTRSGTTPPSTFLSRQSSPLPMKRPTRAPDSFNNSNGDPLKLDQTPLGGLSLAGSSQLNLTETSRAAMDILDASWSSLQGLASSVLGSDVRQSSTNADSKTAKARKKPPLSTRPSATRTTSWGPKANASLKVGTGSYEERQAYVQAKKRETLLLADADSTADLATGHKRRVSSDLPDHSAVDQDHDEGALVYIHHVDPEDTISGLTIRYGCQAAMFRKANGFWPSDSVQSRKTVLLPVASCSVKGRPIRPSPTTDLLGDTPDPAEDASASSIVPVPVENNNASTSSPSAESPSSNAKSENGKDRTWKHESWVEIEGFARPVEIGRVPRKSLGFFPRTRRKSPGRADSLRSSISGREQPGFLSSSAPTPERQPSPKINPTTGPTVSAGQPRRQRRRSSLHLTDRGVGTLDDADNPGPSQDKLNRFVSQHIPGLTPRIKPTLAPDQPQQYRSSSESGSSSTTSVSLDNLGGMVEGWVRKVAQRAKTNINEWQHQGQQQQAGGGAVGSSSGAGAGAGAGGAGLRPAPGLDGDLIELDSGLDAARKSNNASSTSLRTAAQQQGPNRRPGLLRDASSPKGQQLVSASRTRSDLGFGLKDD